MRRTSDNHRMAWATPACSEKSSASKDCSVSMTKLRTDRCCPKPTLQRSRRSRRLSMLVASETASRAWDNTTL
eukprot:7030342-Pyramimonas_sp.AAC.3